MTSTQFSELSIQLTKSIPKEIKKNNGIYFTPLSIIEPLINKSLAALVNQELEQEQHLESGLRILEPSCGTCEFVKCLDSRVFNATFDCIELNTQIYQEITKLVFKNQTNIILSDYLKFSPSQLYDLIIGNPPYFVCKKEQVPEEYKEYIVGRPNIFGLFILHSLSMLKPGGILAFIIPKSFFNSAYYANIRYHIKHTCEIIDITEYNVTSANKSLFLDTQQETFGLILRKQMNDQEHLMPEDCQFSFLKGGSYIFSPDAAHLKTYFNNATTLKQMGLAVKTGSVVWNEHKELLSPDETNTTLLYNSNVTNENQIKLTSFKNDEKFQYINMEGTTEPVIVVNRGNGNAKYTFKYALIDKSAPYVVENHLNVIYSTIGREKNDLIKLFKQVIKSFENPRTKEFIALFFGNNGLSKTELETILPIYL